MNNGHKTNDIELLGCVTILFAATIACVTFLRVSGYIDQVAAWLQALGF